jgi:tryptophan halogenase
MRLFEVRGHVPYYKDGFFSRDSWLAVLFGQGLMPSAYDRLADAVPLRQLDAKMRELLDRVRGHVEQMRAHSEVIENYCSEAQPVCQVASL